MSKRIFQLLSLILGLLGLLGCVAAVVTTWSAAARVNRTTENVFGAVDDSFSAVEQRVAQTRDRLQGLKITSEGIKENAKNWTRTEARDRIRSQLGIDDQSERLVSGLQQAGHWLELTESSVQLVQQAFAAASSLGVPVQADAADHLLEQVSSVRAQLTQTTELAETIRERATVAGEESAPEDPFSQVAQLAVSVIATLTSIDSQLEPLRDRLTAIQMRTRVAKVKATRRIRFTAIGATVLLAWMAAGQGCLCYLGWKGWTRRPATPTQ